MEGTVENFAAKMAGTLGLTKPWYIEQAIFDTKEMALRIYVGVGKTATMMIMADAPIAKVVA